MISARTTATEVIITALETITKASGSHTDIGLNVVVRERSNETEVECCALTPGTEAVAPGVTGYMEDITVQYAISAFVDRKTTEIDEYTADPGAEWVIIDALIMDIREAIEGERCQLGEAVDSVQYLGAEPRYHESGGKHCGAELRYTMRLPSTAETSLM